MSKPVALDWNAFYLGEVTPKVKPNKASAVAKTAATVHTALIPKSAFAAAAGVTAGADTWTSVFNTALNMADWLCVGIIIYAGVTWMFSNRTKAIEFLLGGSIGYVIVRHAVDIRNWLRTL